MSTPPSSIAYRPYLDGLRALAVIMVFVFHANGTFMQGGFIGVDIFFVLSGYLITRVFLRRRESGSELGLSGFYARRSRRLLPAIFVMVSAVAMYEALYGSLLEASTRAREVVTTLLYVSNWNLIFQADEYFAAAAEASPLRHTWSLAVEEQFYIVFPVLLLVALILGSRRWLWTPVFLGSLAMVSAVAMAVIYSPLNVVRVYYGTDTRAHQLLIGAILGVVLHRLQPHLRDISSRTTHLADAAAGLSLVSILVLSFVVSGGESFYFLGGSVLVALVAAALIGATEMAPTGYTARALSMRPAVAVGKVSYGFYLWHWPIILWLAAPATATFAERRFMNLSQFAVTLAISSISLLLIEQPIRERRGIFGKLTSRRTVALGLSVSVGAAVVFGLVLSPPAVAPPDVAVAAPFQDEAEDVVATDPQPTEDETTSTVGSSDTQEPATSPVSTTRPQTPDEIAATAVADRSYEPCPDNPRPCVKYEPINDPGAPTVAVIGDSTAQAYDPAMKLLAEEYGFRYVHAAVGGCSISHRLLATGSDGELHKASNFMCWDMVPEIYEEVLETWGPVLFLATSWNESNQHVEGDVLIESGTPEHYLSVTGHLRETIDVLADDATVAFIDILPPGPSVECLEDGEPTDPVCTRAVNPESREKAYNAIFAELADEDPRVVAISLTDIVCPNDACPLMLDGTVVRYDGGHFTATASRRLAPLLDSRLVEVGVNLADLAVALP